MASRSARTPCRVPSVASSSGTPPSGHTRASAVGRRSRSSKDVRRLICGLDSSLAPGTPLAHPAPRRKSPCGDDAAPDSSSSSRTPRAPHICPLSRFDAWRETARAWTSGATGRDEGERVLDVRNTLAATRYDHRCGRLRGTEHGVKTSSIPQKESLNHYRRRRPGTLGAPGRDQRLPIECDEQAVPSLSRTRRRTPQGRR